MTRIAILTPTRGRPEQCRRMVESAFRTSTKHVDIHLAVCKEDNWRAYSEMVANFKPVEKEPRDGYGIKTVSVPDWPTVQSWNHLALFPDVQSADLVMLGADDMVFSTEGWDKALIDHYNALENKIHVYHLQDSRSSDGTPHPIVTREYIDAMGYFIPPIFLHWFCDTWTVAISRSVGAFTQLKGYALTHDKPSDRGEADETHNRIRMAGWHERDKYVNDTCGHFLELEKERLGMKIAGWDMDGSDITICIKSKQ